ncbi:hypothetical protein [Streptomyces sp. NPDC060194]|uniref:hypothetical protein n=1 Tax=Streptomyces sp. NPDC060194 TaxID=3347069 RepID=UPI003661D985
MSDATALATGAILLCRADADAVRPAAHLLRERQLLMPAGEGWTALVPASTPWAAGSGPVDRVMGGWAAALAVGAPWPVVALWWDGDRAGCTLASGFRRPVSYVWLADGTPVGEDEAMLTFAARLSLDPVHDVGLLEDLTRTDPAADARVRLTGLLAVLARTGLDLPAGLHPGDSADRLRAVARVAHDAAVVEWAGWRDAVRHELSVVEHGPLGPWLRGPRARLLGAVQLAAGVPLIAYGARSRSAGWATTGTLLLAHGALGLAYDRVRAGERSAGGRGA